MAQVYCFECSKPLMGDYADDPCLDRYGNALCIDCFDGGEE